MKVITLGGPLVELQARLQRSGIRAQNAEQQARHWQLVAEQSERKRDQGLAAATADRSAACAFEQRGAQLAAELDACAHERDALVTQLAEAQAAAALREGQLSQRVAVPEEKLDGLGAELQEARRVKQMAADRLAKAWQRLGASDQEAKAFVQVGVCASFNSSALSHLGCSATRLPFFSRFSIPTSTHDYPITPPIPILRRSLMNPTASCACCSASATSWRATTRCCAARWRTGRRM